MHENTLQSSLFYVNSDVVPAAMTGQANSFRPIHYLGSKLRILPEIDFALDQVDPNRGPVLDLFAGSGTVALMAARKRSVIANDIQEYSRVICEALLCRPSRKFDLLKSFRNQLADDVLAPLLNETLREVCEVEERCLRQVSLQVDEVSADFFVNHEPFIVSTAMAASTSGAYGQLLSVAADRLTRAGLMGSKKTTAVRYFGGVYFSYRQAIEIDSILSTIDTFDPQYRALLTAPLLSAVSDIVNTVGKQFAQPIQLKRKDGSLKTHLFKKVTRDRSISVRARYFECLKFYLEQPESEYPHNVVCGDFASVLDEEAGRYAVVYADPPYTRDHYSRFYHVLETLSLRDNPTLSTSAPKKSTSSAIYRTVRHQSPFCIKTRAHGAFDTLFSKSALCGSALVLSYSPFASHKQSHPRLVTIDDLMDIARKYYASVEVRDVEGFSHSKLNRSDLNFGKPATAEVLIICK